ncbi:MAG TPA: tyrosine--tRNA ligase [Dehalococcoidia bacterium]|nr:tyrosine--tRNA ligase [Dehalococcoidia bacterium]
MTGTRFATILERGVAEIITEAELLRLLNSGRILTLKQGFDPSAPDIHLGHVVGLRKLRQFQKLGHKVTLIVGDWTARIGDPSGQSATRPMLSPNEIESNAQTYMEQFFKVVDKDKTEIRWQSEWYSQFTLDEVIKLTSKFTIAQLLAREDFNKRYGSGNPISLTEMLYPLLQGYDSVAIQADVEFGGSDQKFNCLVGRELQQSTGQPPQQIFLVPLLIGTDGHQKMSKSLNNQIGVAEPPREIYGKVMSIPDHLIVDYFELVTDVPEEEIAEFKEQLKTRSVNPMNLKKRLAHEIVMQFHGKRAADEAQEHFTQVFQKREIPKETRTVELRGVLRPSGKLEIEVQRDITSLLVEAGLAKSRSEANRLLAQGAIEVDGEKVSTSLVSLKDGTIIKVGKRRFLRMVDSMKRDWETANS